MILVFTHVDADGVTAARMALMMEGVREAEAVPMSEDVTPRSGKAVVYLTGSVFFGLPLDESMLIVRALSPERVYVLDLGTTRETLEAARAISSLAEVVLIDHHPPDWEAAKAYASPSLKVINVPDNCTAGLVYEYAKENGMLPDDPLFALFAAVGIHGDMAADKDGAKQVLDEVSKQLPEVGWEVVQTFNHRERSMPLPVRYSRFLNTARRVAYDYGAKVAFLSLGEIQDYGGLALLEDVFNPRGTDYTLEARFPYTALLRRWYYDWLSEREKVLSSMRGISTPLVTVYFLDHPWDVGGYAASVRASSKPTFTVNYGCPDEDYAVLHGRAGRSKIDLSAVMARAEEISAGTIRGGGHPEAVGGVVARSLPRKDVVRFLHEAVAATV